MALACCALPGCGGGSSSSTPGTGAVTSAGGGSAATPGNAGATTASSNAGNSTGTAGATGATDGGGAAGTGPAVPRVENTTGTSVLVSPPSASVGSNGKCSGGAVYCGGTCLDAEGKAAGNCTAVKLNLGQTRSMALTDTALFYTAANQEIIKLDLASNTNKSLVTGLAFVKALVAEGNNLYFTTKTPSSFFRYDVRRVGYDGGDVTVLSPSLSQEVGTIVPLADRLLLGLGNFSYTLSTIPKAGGASTKFGSLNSVYSVAVGGSTLYYSAFSGIGSTNLDSPAASTILYRASSSANLLLEGGYLYYINSNEYVRLPITGGTPETVQPLSNAGIRGRVGNLVIVAQADATDTKVTHLLTMPITGGTPTELVTLEYGELQDVVGNATDLYLAVGSTYAGAILRVKL